MAGGRRCTALNAKGEPCKGWAVRDSEYCLRHSMTDEAWAEQSARARQLALAAKQEQAERERPLRTAKRERFDMPIAESRRVALALGPLLEATLGPDGEPDMERRALAALVALIAWRMRPEALGVLWPKIAPRAPLSRTDLAALNLDRARDTLREAMDKARRDGSLRDLPDWLVERCDFLIGSASR